MLVKVLKTRKEMIAWRKACDANQRIGFVPTMGALHQGHLSLIKKSKRECDKTVVSIFVNPTQFGPQEDFKKYPRKHKKDLSLLKLEGVDCVWIPKSIKEVYPNEVETFVKARQSLCEMMEGLHRPGHFDGVVTVVAKLFQLVEPHRAYFGEKDFQQLKVIEAMVEDLFFLVKIRPCKIVREKSGLAMSSRNQYFSKDDRQAAAQLHEILRSADSIAKAKTALKKSDFNLEYLESWNEDLSKQTTASPCRWLVAARFKGVRLIDNIVR